MKSYTLNELNKRRKEGTFGEIFEDWKWIFSYSKRFKGSILVYTILGLLSSTLGLVSSIAGKFLVDVVIGHKSDQLWLAALVMGGSVLLSGFPGAIHVRVTASETTRLNTIARKYRITADEANEVLDIGDRKHRKFVRTVYGKDITAPEQFDLILNTDRLSVDECVDAIAELARKHDIRVKLAQSNESSKTIDHQTRNIAFKNETEEEFAKILSLYNIEWLYEPKTFPVEWDAEGNVTMAISPDFYLPKFNLYLELTTMDQRYVTKKNKKMRLVKELYPGTNIRIVYKKDFNELVDRLKMFGGIGDNS